VLLNKANTYADVFADSAYRSAEAEARLKADACEPGGPLHRCAHRTGSGRPRATAAWPIYGVGAGSVCEVLARLNLVIHRPTYYQCGPFYAL
jgi:hypothetical protein